MVRGGFGLRLGGGARCDQVWGPWLMAAHWPKNRSRGAAWPYGWMGGGCDKEWLADGVDAWLGRARGRYGERGGRATLYRAYALGSAVASTFGGARGAVLWWMRGAGELGMRSGCGLGLNGWLGCWLRRWLALNSLRAAQPRTILTCLRPFQPSTGRNVFGAGGGGWRKVFCATRGYVIP